MPPKSYPTPSTMTSSQKFRHHLDIALRNHTIGQLLKHQPKVKGSFKRFSLKQKGRGNVSNLSGITNHHMSFPELLRGVY